LVILVFVFIGKGSSIVFVPLVEALSYVLSLLLSLIVIFLYLKIDFSWPRWKLIGEQLRTGRHIFLFSLFNWMITGGAIVAVEKFLSGTELGYYATFSRLMYFAFALAQPINMALFPYMSAKANLPVNERLGFVLDTFKVYGVFVLVFLAAVFTLSEWMFVILFDDKFTSGLPPFMPVFYVMAVWISLVMVNYFIGLQVLVAFGKDKVYSRSYFINTLVAVAGFLILIPSIGMMGVPVSLISGEIILFVFLCAAFSNIRREGGQMKNQQQ
jgi:PST family polysaccharide transporter